MSDRAEPPSQIPYAPRPYRYRAELQSTASEVKITFPRLEAKTPVMLASASLLTIVTSILLLAIVGLPDRLHHLAPFVGLVLMVPLGVVIMSVVQLIQVPRHDVIVANAKGFRIEQWCVTLERDIQIDWQDVRKLFFQEWKRKRILRIITSSGNWNVELNYPIGNEAEVIECLVHRNSVREITPSALPVEASPTVD